MSCSAGEVPTSRQKVMAAAAQGVAAAAAINMDLVFEDSRWAVEGIADTATVT